MLERLGEGTAHQNQKPHFSQRTREMGHPTVIILPTFYCGVQSVTGGWAWPTGVFNDGE
jgi:hypothetical protein